MQLIQESIALNGSSSSSPQSSGDDEIQKKQRLALLTSIKGKYKHVQTSSESFALRKI
jgi:hypothetical protein